MNQSARLYDIEQNMIENDIRVRYVFTIRTENEILGTITYDFTDYQIYHNDGARLLIDSVKKLFNENVYIIYDLFVVDLIKYPSPTHLELTEYKRYII